MKKYLLYSLLIVLCFACRKNIDENITTDPNIPDPVVTIVDFNLEHVSVVASVYGVVVDEAGEAVIGANVNLKNNVTYTDNKGRFVIKDANMNAKGTLITIEKTNYFQGSKRFFPKEGSLNYLKVVMLDKTNIGSFNASTGGVISSPENIELDFPANSIVMDDGTLYNGEVNVFARNIDATANNLQAIMPGGLQGIDQNEEEVALASFGMMAVELETTNGIKLNLGNNRQASLSFPVASSLLANAPSEIPLWYFHDRGVWVEEGSATLQGNKYVGDVAHFSFWNCDAPFPLIEIEGTILTANGNPLSNAQVVIKVTSSGITGAGTTNSNGVFSGKIPKDEELELAIYYDDICTGLTNNIIGPFSTDTDIGNITVNTGDFIEISGTLNGCDALPISNGWVVITLANQDFYYYINDGTAISIAIPNCTNETQLTVQAINVDDLQSSEAVTVPILISTIDFGTIDICGNEIEEYLIFEIDGIVQTAFNVDFSVGGLRPRLSGNGPNISCSFSFIDSIDVANSYDNSEIRSASFYVADDNLGIVSSCNNLLNNPCGNNELIITEIGDIGELVTGYFNGEMVFYNEQDSTNLGVLPYQGSFKIIRD